MSKKLAIKGHPTRGNEVIELFKMMGGWECGYCGCGTGFYYYISQFGNIEASCKPSKFDTYIVYTLEEFLEKFPYKVGDIVKTGKDEEGVIKQMRWVNNDIVYWVNSHKTCDWTQTLSVDVLDKYNRVNSNDVDVKVESTGFMQICKTAGIIFNDANYADEVELNLGDYEIEVRDGRTFAVKKKSKYPDNYDECVRIAKNIHGYDIHIDTPAYGELMESFVKLLICRDAYWKIAGEQMDLDKPWNSKYGCGKWGYWIGYDINANKIYCQDSRLLLNRVLVFPTKEMRDVFYENFKDLIEQCKELL